MLCEDEAFLVHDLWVLLRSFKSALSMKDLEKEFRSFICSDIPLYPDNTDVPQLVTKYPCFFKVENDMVSAVSVDLQYIIELSDSTSIHMYSIAIAILVAYEPSLWL